MVKFLASTLMALLFAACSTQSIHESTEQEKVHARTPSSYDMPVYEEANHALDDGFVSEELEDSDTESPLGESY